MGKRGFVKKTVKGILEAAIWLIAAYAGFYHFYFADTFFTLEEAVFQTAVIILILFVIRTLVFHIVWRIRKRRIAQHYETHSAYINLLERDNRVRQDKASCTVSRRSGKRRIPARIPVIMLLAAAVVFAGVAVHRSAIENSIPESLQEMKERYPETAAFVDDYPTEGNVSHSMDISSEVTKGEIPLFLQWDERWGYEQYGSDFLGITGCGPTCLSMVYSGLTGNTDRNPYRMAVFSEESGYYVDGEGTSWDLMTEGAEKLGLHAENLDISAENIRHALSSGHPVICSMYPGDFTTSGHFIVLTGIDGDGNVTVRDPNSRINSGKTWTIDRLLSQIHAMWEYSAG